MLSFAPCNLILYHGNCSAKVSLLQYYPQNSCPWRILDGNLKIQTRKNFWRHQDLSIWVDILDNDTHSVLGSPPFQKFPQLTIPLMISPTAPIFSPMILQPLLRNLNFLSFTNLQSPQRWTFTSLTSWSSSQTFITLRLQRDRTSMDVQQCTEHFEDNSSTHGVIFV